jgi:hypothetical protein
MSSRAGRDQEGDDAGTRERRWRSARCRASYDDGGIDQERDHHQRIDRARIRSVPGGDADRPGIQTRIG